MSRIGKAPVEIPKGVEVKMSGRELSVKGSKGVLTREIPEFIKMDIGDEQIVVSLTEDALEKKNFHGLYRVLINNMVVGVSEGFKKELEMIGVGYRAAVSGKLLDLQLGFSHPTKLTIPDDLSVKVENNTQIIVSGIDKMRVGQFSADIRILRKPEPYKGKGIRYKGEYVRRKAGKTAKA